MSRARHAVAAPDRRLPTVRITIMTVLSALLVLHHYVAAPPDGNAVVEAGDRRYQYEAPSEPLPEPERSWPGTPVASRAVLVTIGSAWPRSMVIDRRGT